MNLMKTPRAVDIEITSRCNLRCKYCSHFTSAGDVRYDLPMDEWLKFFKELNRLSVMSVCLSGGEPFYREDLKAIIQGIVDNRMRFTILTNGTLITDEIASFIAETRRCDNVQVSIDGSNPMAHDSFRGDGVFFKAMNGLRSLLRYGLPVSVRVTIHRNNVKEIEDIARLLLEDIGLPSFSTNSASYMGLCRRNADMVMLTTEERSVAMEALLRLNKRYRGRILASAGPLAEARRWIRMVRAFHQDEEPFPDGGYLRGCNGLMNRLSVRADGVIVPCAQMSHIGLGTINKDDLMVIWQEHPELIRIRQRRSIPLSSFAFCDGCEYINYCTGNCPALAYTVMNNDTHPSPDACLRRFLNEGGRLPDEALLFEEEVNGRC
ncbi:MAG: hypothetical protein Fur0020_10170 [Thermodesulfovibrionia bacterium]